MDRTSVDYKLKKYKYLYENSNDANKREVYLQKIKYYENVLGGGGKNDEEKIVEIKKQIALIEKDLDQNKKVLIKINDLIVMLKNFVCSKWYMCILDTQNVNYNNIKKEINGDIGRLEELLKGKIGTQFKKSLIQDLLLLKTHLPETTNKTSEPTSAPTLTPEPVQPVSSEIISPQVPKKVPPPVPPTPTECETYREYKTYCTEPNNYSVNYKEWCNEKYPAHLKENKDKCKACKPNERCLNCILYELCPKTPSQTPRVSDA